MTKKSTYLIIFFISYLLSSFQIKGQEINKVLHQITKDYKNAAYKKASIYNTKKIVPKTTKDSLSLSKIIHTKANAFYEMSDYLKAIALYDKAILFTTTNDEGKNLKGTILYDKAFAEYYLNNRVKSYKTVKKAEAILSKLQNPNYDYLLSIYADLGGEASSLGFYNEAEFYLQKGYSIYVDKLKRKKVSVKNEASKPVLFLYKFIYLYHLNGDEEKLLSNFKTLETHKKNHKLNDKEQLMYAASLNCVADHFLNLKGKLKTQKTLEKGNLYLEKAFKALDKNKSKTSFIQFTFNKAKYYRYSKQFDKALKANKELTKLAGEKDVRIPFFVAQKGLIFLDSNQKEKALHEFKKMAQLIHADSTKLTTDFSNFKPSNTLNHTGLLVEVADEALKKHPNDSILKKQLNNFYKIGLQQFKNCYEFAVFNDKLKTYYHKAINGILKTSGKKVSKLMLTNILNDIENIENKFAWKTFQQNKILVNAAIPDSILNKETFLRNQLVKARKNNNDFEISSVKNQIEKHKENLKEKYPKLFTYIYKDFKISDLQKKLTNQDIVLRYKKIDTTLYLFIIDKTTSEVVPILFSKKEETTINNYIKTLKNKKEDKETANIIFNTLVPFSISEKKNLIIIPDDNLHHLPFETLVRNSNYLLTDFNIQYTSYMVFLSNSKNVNTTTNTIHLYAPEYNTNAIDSNRTNFQQLKGAQKEVSEIEKIFNSTTLFQKKRNKKDFLKSASQSDILHLAMHAKIDNKKPELSYFSFGSSTTENLYLEELYGLQLKAKLAVLSACNTGTSQMNNYLGSSSLQRAFTLAGVSSTVSSLWEAPDEATKTIMIAFYKNLNKGLPKSEALKKAKLEYLNTTTDINFKAPYYWAGFVVSGDIAPITTTSKNWIIYIAIILSVLLLGFLFQRFQKR